MKQRPINFLLRPLFRFFNKVRSIGVTEEMDGYSKSRLAIFNLINFFGLITGILIPVMALFSKGYLPLIAWVVAAAPAFISLGVLLGNYFLRHQFAMLWYFTLYPFVTLLVYLSNIDVGIELFFIFYAVLAVFFLQKLWHILGVILLSLFCFILVYLAKQNYSFVMAEINYFFYVFNHVLSLLFIFGGLFLIKKENIDYQAEILLSNSELSNYNTEIEKQKEELTRLNNFKTKLFSVISHDARTPLYGLKNLLKSILEHDIPGDEIKTFLPEMLKDLTYTTDLVENLLQWAKSQMKGEVLNEQLFDIGGLVGTVKKVLQLPADNKKVFITTVIPGTVYVYADKEMIEVVIRNLISNAIKFTPSGGKVTVSVKQDEGEVEVKVADTGIGISKAIQQKLFKDEYFTTKGTSNESGTGLGLMICRDFITRNGGKISVESLPDNGSTFSFTLPKA